ncbi:MAG TPA: transporter [Candidatus Cybelea sp.]|nr:transporter [Candidatus Cybelea sp.]
MLRKCWLFLLGGLLAGTNSAYAQDAIATDRPAFTASSIVVPQGTLQFENGVARTITEGDSMFDFPETLVRFGVASKTELRVAAPDYLDAFGSASPVSGFGDVLVGVKQQLGPTPGGFDVSAILSLSLPSGSKGISSGGYDPQFQLPWSHALTKNWTADGMFAAYWPTQGKRRNGTGQAALEFDREITNSWDAFIEYNGEFAQRGGPEHVIHFGTAYRFTSNQQIDLHVGFGLSSAAADQIIGVGYSFRFRVLGR